MSYTGDMFHVGFMARNPITAQALASRARILDSAMSVYAKNATTTWTLVATLATTVVIGLIVEMDIQISRAILGQVRVTTSRS